MDVTVTLTCQELNSSSNQFKATFTTETVKKMAQLELSVTSEHRKLKLTLPRRISESLGQAKTVSV